MLKKDFLFAWIISSVVMFVMSYTWHGIVLNDYKFIDQPLSVFLSLQAIVYLVIGFVLTFIYHYTHIKKKLKYKGMILGAVLGFFTYLIIYVLGISFLEGTASYVVVVNFLWQMSEQAVGGGVVGFVFIVLDRVRKLADVD